MKKKYCKIIKEQTALFSIIFLFFINAFQISAQYEYNLFSFDSTITYGGFVHFNINKHYADFKDFEGIETCCPRFGDGNGQGISGGVYFELPFPNILKIGLRAEFNSISANLLKDEPTTVIIDDFLDEGIFRHSLSTSIWNLGVSPYLTMRIYRGLNIFAGGHYGYIIKSKFEYVEQLAKPVDRGVFIDTGTRERNKFAGDIPNYSQIYGSIFIGFSYDLPINKEQNLRISPEILYYKGLTELAFQKNWMADVIKLGASIKYSFLPEKKEIPKIKKYEQYIDTLFVEVDYFPEKYFIKGNDYVIDDIIQTKDSIILIEKYFRTDTVFKLAKPIAKINTPTEIINIRARFVTEAFPLLPIVFFSKESAEIPNEYLTGDEDFDVTKFEIKPIVYHRNILKIIGKRLRENPRSSITLIGYADSTTENSDCKLALNRAEAVKQYMIEEMDIKANRIKLNRSERKCSPINPTLTPNDSGYSENRRVEIISDNPKILAPIIRENFLEIEYFEPVEINIDLSETSKFAQKRTLIIKQNDAVLKQLDVSGKNSIKIPLDENLAKNLVAGKLWLELYIEDNTGQTSKDTKTIKVNKDTNDYAVERLSIVLFDVGSDKLSQFAINSIKTFVKDLKSGSKVKVTGYTDELGFRETNVILSQNRAQNVANIIKEHQPEAEIISIEGIASKRKPYGIQSYGTPAERFLSRTVQIEILKFLK